MKLTNKLRTGALAASLVTALGLSACTDRELVKIGNSPPFVFMPRVLEPGAIRDARENEQVRNAEDRARQNQESGIRVTTPQGYVVELREHRQIMNHGVKNYISAINPPYITITSEDNDGDAFPYRNGVKRTIFIKDLEMMNK